MQDLFANFIDKLTKVNLGDTAYNQYSYGNPGNSVRRNNLLLYFQQIHQKKPTILLVGEAPGYQGTRQTGVPFGSEYIILKGVPAIGMFGKDYGYQKSNEYDRIWKEPSATIVWETLATLPNIPLIWSSFPFHPHQKGNPLSNRAPTAEELKIGQPFLQEIVTIFNIKKIIAVGNSAEKTLSEMGIQAPKVRHPSHGGKNLFQQGLINNI